MNYEIGDLVTRNSYNNDTIFRIVDIREDIYYLKGVNVRLYADSNGDDLKEYKKEEEERDDSSFLKIIDELISFEKDYFYVPGKILHIDGDKEYLERCIDFYKKANVMAYGYNIKEDMISDSVYHLLKNIRPNILIITGHDAYYKKREDINNLESYKNSANFVRGVEMARRYEPDYEKLVIIAGACQSNYEKILQAGANFASSPRRINIHALDPAIIATSVSLTDKTKEIDLINIISKTSTGKKGLGGLKTKGTMYVGYPR